MKKILIPTLCAVFLILALAACGGGSTDDAAATAPPLPTPTEGTQITTFTCKVASRDGTTFKLDIDVASMKTTIYGAAAASESPETSEDPEATGPASAGTATGVLVEIPANAAVTLLNGEAGKLSDLKNGNVVTMTKTGTVVTAITVVSKR